MPGSPYGARNCQYLSPDIAGTIVEGYVGRRYPSEHSPASILTPREREIIQLLSEGYSSPEIAGHLQYRARDGRSTSAQHHEIARFAQRRCAHQVRGTRRRDLARLKMEARDPWKMACPTCRTYKVFYRNSVKKIA